MTKYEMRKDKARQKAIRWQEETAQKSYSYGELADFWERFYRLAKRYGLIKEFKDNGIL